MPYIIHIAAEGERWDTLAYRYYGNAFQYIPLVETNKALKITDLFSGGERVFIPVLPNEPQKSESLPPWKR